MGEDIRQVMFLIHLLAQPTNRSRNTSSLVTQVVIVIVIVLSSFEEFDRPGAYHYSPEDVEA